MIMFINIKPTFRQKVMACGYSTTDYAQWRALGAQAPPQI